MSHGDKAWSPVQQWTYNNSTVQFSKWVLEVVRPENLGAKNTFVVFTLALR
jgi:cobalamin biosynthesis Mg chelatase CobN